MRNRRFFLHRFFYMEKIICSKQQATKIIFSYRDYSSTVLTDDKQTTFSYLAIYILFLNHFSKIARKPEKNR